MKDKEDINEYKVVPDKYIDKILEIFHKNNGHRGYKYLVNNILKAEYYFNNMYKKCNTFIKNCIICTQQKKIYFKPNIIQIILDYNYIKDVEYVLKDIKIQSKNFDEDITITFTLPIEKLDAIKEMLKNCIK